MRRRLVVLGVLAALALVACSGGDDGDGAAPVVTGGGGNGDDPGSGDVEPCELLSTEEVAAAAGNPVGEGAADIVTATCSWDAAPDATTVGVTFLAFGVPRICAEGLAADSANEPVEGFDDPAFWTFVPAGGGTGSLAVCTEGGQLIVTVTAGAGAAVDEAALRATAETLTGHAIARL
ncbi:MAG TPA: DUF3558 family protein [Acidimicrobiia bacterium]